MCAGPVSFEIINLAESIKEIKKVRFTGLLFFKTILALSFAASSISPGPGATNIGYLFLYISFNFMIKSKK